FPHRLLKLDEVADDSIALAQAISDAMQIPLTAATARALGPQHLAPGHWRGFAEPLAEAFALLTPVSVRLGYPEA
ncbi:MAG TPA: adenylate cyclase, partial [Lysobacter sp.]|nr:adenylate cyclase [Lysobacter sp.]